MDAKIHSNFEARIKAIDSANLTTWEMFISFLALLVSMVWEMWGGNRPSEKEIEEFVDAALKLWMKYLNIKWIPDIFEENVLRELFKMFVTLVIDALCKPKPAIKKVEK